MNSLHASLTEGTWNRPQSATVRRKVTLDHSNIADKMSLQAERAQRKHGLCATCAFFASVDALRERGCARA
jgi:hypothetical protein